MNNRPNETVMVYEFVYGLFTLNVLSKGIHSTDY